MSTPLKTRENDASVAEFLDAVEPEQRRQDGWAVLELMQTITGEPPRMWGASIVGFGHYHYRYASGREADWMITGFSPRKTSLTLYIMAGFSRYDNLLERLGRFKTGKSCLYIKRLSDVDLDILSELVAESVEYMKATYPSS